MFFMNKFVDIPNDLFYFAVDNWYANQTGQPLRECNRPRIQCNNIHHHITSAQKPNEKTIICTQCNAKLLQWRHNNIVQQIVAKTKDACYYTHNDRNVDSSKFGNLKPDLVNT